MNLKFKRLIRLTLACFLTLALMATAGVATASANESKRPEGEHGSQAKRFEDGDEASWAALFMEKMNLKGVVLGMPDGSFRPNAPVTHEQAVTMVIRVMGLETEAKTKTGASLTFKDNSKISSWALGYVEEAVEKGVLSWGQDGLFKPNEPTTRLEVAVMLVKALGLADQAAQQTGKLDFVDKTNIPQDQAGFILIAVDKGLVLGAPNSNGKGYVFQGNKPVTRAEMTAFMDREDGAIDQPDEDEVKGTVVSVTTTGEPSITVTKKDGTEGTYKIAADARIFVEKKLGLLADVKPGDQVNLHLDQNGVAVFLDIRYVDRVKGTVTAISATSVTIIAKDGTESTYSIDLNCKVVIEAGEENDNQEGQTSGTTGTTGTTVTMPTPAAPTVADVKVGDRVALELTRGVVTKIEVKELEDAEGTVTALTAASGTTPGSITIQTKEGATLTYSVAAEVKVRLQADEQAANFASIVVGDKVELTFKNRLVVEIKIEKQEGQDQPTQSQTLNGIIKSVDATAKTFVMTVQPAAAGGTAVDYTVTVSDTTTYVKNGQTATFADLAVGQTVDVTGKTGSDGKFAAEKVEIK